ncbi:MAG: hypothetical protein DDT31_01925 [Syntrophomonadaceae bacterium]|nr:hypothetical protein [Bacillota bacterium]
MKIKIDKKEVLSLGVIIAICVWLYRVAQNFPEATRGYPQWILIGIGVLAVFEMILKTVRLSKTDYQESVAEKSPAVLIRVLSVTAICVIYVLLVDILGFFSSTAVFSVALMYYLGVRKPMNLIAVAAGLNLGIFKNIDATGATVLRGLILGGLKSGGDFFTYIQFTEHHCNDFRDCRRYNNWSVAGLDCCYGNIPSNSIYIRHASGDRHTALDDNI